MEGGSRYNGGKMGEVLDIMEVKWGEVLEI